MPNFSGLWTGRQQMQVRGADTWPAVPGAPTIGTATATSGTTASVAFTAPTNLGYPAAITGYTVTSNPGGLTGTGASSPITVSGLTTATAYTFTVTATNATGTGPASAASNSATPAVYIEDVFSTYLYTGTGTTRTITNNIDLATYGGLIWAKNRSSTATHHLCDTVRGVTRPLHSETTAGQGSETQQITGVTTSGFTLGTDGASNSPNYAGSYFASWTFRKQAKFFDIVTYTGDGTAGRSIAHNLGAMPGCIILKRTNTTSEWKVWHAGLTAGSVLDLNVSDAATANALYYFGNNSSYIAPTSSAFTVATGGGFNDVGSTYVAYIFGHNTGGFGVTGTDNVISCGSFTCDSSGNATVNLGYEPQYLLIKNSSSAIPWWEVNNMSGFVAAPGTATQYLAANTTSAEASWGTVMAPTATGFVGSQLGANTTNIYIAIRRGQMKVPTDATKVFSPYNVTVAANASVTTGFPVDMVYGLIRGGGDHDMVDRLRWINNAAGSSPYLKTDSTSAELSQNIIYNADNNTGYKFGSYYSGATSVFYSFKRAPSFFDEVCYTGDGGAYTTLNHNLGVAPELVICKSRSNTQNWGVWTAAGNASASMTGISLNSTAAAVYTNQDFSAYMLPTTFTPGLVYSGTYSSTETGNVNARTYVAYLFATCAGVSKVGSYTGTGTLTTVDCGFAGGARFVMIKRTDTTSAWFIWDTARGMVAGTDPVLYANVSTAESNANSVYTITTGFQLLASPSADVNTSGGTYIYLAIA